MLQARNYHVSYCLRAWSLLDMSVALRDLETTFSANQISVSNLLWSNAQQRPEDIQQYCLLVISLVHITTANVYCVIPDNHYPTNDSCSII